MNEEELVSKMNRFLEIAGSRNLKFETVHYEFVDVVQCRIEFFHRLFRDSDEWWRIWTWGSGDWFLYDDMHNFFDRCRVMYKNRQECKRKNTTADFRFLEIAGSCSSLEELQVKLDLFIP